MSLFNTFRNIYRKIIPSETRIKIWQNTRNIKLKILEILANKNEEKIEVINYLKKNTAVMIPYEFTKKYKAEDINVYRDNDYKYVIHENKKLYFPQNWMEEKIQVYYNSLLMEQDINSPHRYEYNNIQINHGDVIVDIGAAEGIFALSSVEKAKKIYLFECDELWVNALKMTFLPYREKTVIVNKYVEERSNNNDTVTIDNFFHEKKIDFIKADVEGAELEILKGASEYLSSSKNLKLSICTYHNKNDARKMKQLLLRHGFRVEFSKGYILSTWSKKIDFRKGLIRGYK